MGELINESKEAKTALKAIPIEFAKYYIEELILEYKRVKKPNESFEKFYDRILSNYSFGAISFMMSFNYMVSKKLKNESLRLLLDESPKTAAHEPFEIFHFGQKLYEKIKDKTPDEKIALIVNKMIDSSRQSTEDFSELLAEINRF